jgi:bifunctional non-homologous end joining protein LigD
MSQEFTHLDKIFWPKEKITKGDVIRYYERIADVILPYLRHRPMVLARHPNGIKGVSFFQKNVDPKRLPRFVQSMSIRAKSTGRHVHYIVCNNKSTLLYLANLGCIELHPFNSRDRKLQCPDFMVIDLDPGGNPFSDTITVAREVRKVVESVGGTCFVKTSGKRGLHVYLPLSATHDFAEVRAVSRLIVRLVHQRLPRLTSLARSPSNRRHKIYLDYVRNCIGQTVVAPYSLRAYPEATVATPLQWSELTTSLRPQRYTLRTIFRRINRKGDIWKKTFHGAVNLKRLAKALEKLTAEERARRRAQSRR